MRRKAKAALLVTKRLKRRESIERVEELQYTSPAEFIQDCQKFEREIKHYASLRVEPRACVYGIPSSVPFSRGWI